MFYNGEHIAAYQNYTPRVTQIKTIWLALSICQPFFVHLGEALRNFVLQPLRTLREIVTTKGTKNPRDRYYYQLPRITQIATDYNYLVGPIKLSTFLCASW
jgi:hypothetical protein